MIFLYCYDVLSTALMTTSEPLEDSTGGSADDEFGSTRVALYIILPILLFCFGGSCLAYGIHRLCRTCHEQDKKQQQLLLNIENVRSASVQAENEKVKEGDDKFHHRPSSANKDNIDNEISLPDNGNYDNREVYYSDLEQRNSNSHRYNNHPYNHPNSNSYDNSYDNPNHNPYDNSYNKPYNRANEPFNGTMNKNSNYGSGGYYRREQAMVGQRRYPYNRQFVSTPLDERLRDVETPRPLSSTGVDVNVSNGRPMTGRLSRLSASHLYRQNMELDPILEYKRADLLANASREASARRVQVNNK